MAEYPILFKPHLVKAILEGKKIETRRIVMPQPPEDYNVAVCDACGKVCWLDIFNENYCHCWPEDGVLRSPYGGAGDILWVREKHVFETNLGYESAESYQPPFSDGRPTFAGHDEYFGKYWKQAHYAATDPTPDLYYEDDDNDEPKCKWRPSIHMPRWACRLFLTVTGLRIERVQKITNEGAILEGIPEGPRYGDSIVIPHYWPVAQRARYEFALLWDEINSGRGYSWDSNPWVWVITFKIRRALCR